MGRSGGKKKGKQTKQAATTSDQPADDGSMIWVDPNRVRFQHSKIRPLFSGCGRSIYDTLDSIRNHEISPSDLPPIQVIVGPDDWYFSLNNRRLWVLKKCRDEGLLENNNNQIQVRVRAPKSSAEEARYSLQNCALEAKVMREPEKQQQQQQQQQQKPRDKKKRNATVKDDGNNVGEAFIPQDNCNSEDLLHVSPTGPTSCSEEEDSEDEDSDNEGYYISKNPFSALL